MAIQSIVDLESIDSHQSDWLERQIYKGNTYTGNGLEYGFYAN